MKEKTYYISGMHCASCELLIEKRVLKENNVSSADASLGNKTLSLGYEKYAPTPQQLNQWFKGDGYVFSEAPIEKTKDPLVYFEEGKGIRVDTKILKKRLNTLGTMLAILLILIVLERSGVGRFVNINDSSSFGIFFLFGVVAGLSSCAALVGGLLLSLSKGWNGQHGYEAPLGKKMLPHLYFHAGRLVSYAVLGAVLGGLGRVIAFDNVTVYAFITLAVSVVMLIIGLQMAGVGWAEKLQIRLPKRLTRNVSQANTGSRAYLPFSVGAGTVILPCGFTLAAQGVALASGSVWRGSLILFFFVLGTMIPLLFIGLASAKGSSNPRRGRVFSFYAGVILVLFALYNTNAQLNVLGFRSVSDVLAKKETNGQEVVRPVQNQAGEQVLSMLATGFEYTLTSSANIKAGVPTKLIVDNQGIAGCGRYLSGRGLIKGLVSLEPGVNTIDLGRPSKGTYKLTCSMGMVPPVTVYVN
ncbi:MAG: sulfite exporter TauE/SafE family protein [Candidatus Magasanikbacteria bacterium]|nr:sulfite exporter TauE/SafE family protein [Candidatus Magasanikbacteria bacterium]